MQGYVHLEGTLTLGSVGVQRIESTESVGHLRTMIVESLSWDGLRWHVVKPSRSHGYCGLALREEEMGGIGNLLVGENATLKERPDVGGDARDP